MTSAESTFWTLNQGRHAGRIIRLLAPSELAAVQAKNPRRLLYNILGRAVRAGALKYAHPTADGLLAYGVLTRREG